MRRETSELFEYIIWKPSSIKIFVLIDPVDVEMFQWITEKFDLLVALHGSLRHIKGMIHPLEIRQIRFELQKLNC